MRRFLHFRHRRYIAVALCCLLGPAQFIGLSSQAPVVKTTILDAKFDTFVDSTHPTTNFGSLRYLEAEHDKAKTKITYIAFNAPTLHGKLQKATLSLHTRSVGSATVAEVAIFNPSTVTYKTRPAITHTLGTTTISPITHLFSVDVTDAISAGQTRFAIESTSALISFDSSESGDGPDLKITYVVPSTTTSGTSGSSTVFGTQPGSSESSQYSSTTTLGNSSTTTHQTPTPRESPTTTPTTTMPPPTNSVFGISTGAALWSGSDADREYEFETLSGIGAKWIRGQFPWRAVEPSRGVYVWGKFDTVINQMHANHLQIVAQIDSAPSWANPDLPTNESYQLSENPNDYATFVQAFVERYASKGVEAIEVGNELNLIGKDDNVYTPTSYKNILCATHAKIQAVNHSIVEMPSILSGADGVTYIQSLYSAGVHGCIDAMGFHPYTRPRMPDDPKAIAWQNLFTVHQIMSDHGDGDKKIWATEYGASTDTSDCPKQNCVSEANQAIMLIKAYTLYRSYPWAGPLFWFQYKDQGTDPHNDGNFMGLYRYDGSAKPAVAAYKKLALV